MSRTVFQRSGLCLTLLALLSMPVEATTVTDSRQITTTGQSSFYGNNAEGWYWYQDPQEEEPKEEPLPPPPPPQAPEPEPEPTPEPEPEVPDGGTTGGGTTGGGQTTTPTA